MLHLIFLPQGDNVEELVVCWQEKLFSQVKIKNGFPFEPEKKFKGQSGMSKHKNYTGTKI